MTTNGFSIEPARGGYAVVRPNGATAAISRTRQGAINLAERFIPESIEGLPLEHYVPASWWRRLFNPGAAGHWEEI